MNYTTYHNFDEGAVIVVEFGPMIGVGNFKWGRGNVIYEKGGVDEILGVPEKNAISELPFCETGFEGM